MQLWPALAGRLSDAEQAKLALRWIGGSLMALAVVILAIGYLLFHQLWLSIPTLLLGYTGLQLYQGEISRSGIRAIILASCLALLMAGVVLISAWLPDSKSSAIRLPALMTIFLILVVLVVGLRARHAARIIDPPPAAPWWLP
jgi:hypothetical protein